ncbi:MAG: hypothetical protein U1F66_02000 [bacterium]
MRSIRYFLSLPHFLVWSGLLMACAGVTPSSPPNQGPSGGGGALDAPTQLTEPAAQGSLQAAAQPLQVGQPAPGPDPTKHSFFVEKLYVKPLCKLSGKDLYQYKIHGYVRISNPNEVPEPYVDIISMGSIRAVDQGKSRYTEIPLSYKLTFTDEGQKVFSFGYFEFLLWAPVEYQVAFYLVPPQGNKGVSTPWTSCPNAACVPDPEIPVVVKSTSGLLMGKSGIGDPVGVCEVGGGSLDPPQQFLLDGNHPEE